MANIKNYKLLDITELSASTWSTAEKVLGLDENDKVVMAQPEGNVTPEYVDAEIQEAMAAETARTEEVYAKKSELPDMEDYALTSSVTQDIQTAIASETARTEDTYAKKSEVPDLDDYYTKAQVDAEITGATEGMATETWVQNQGYLTEHQDLSAYAKTTAVTQDIQTAIAAETGRTEETYAKISDIPSLSDYYTKSEVDAEITGATEGLATEAYVTAATANLASTGYVDASITAATATETARTESTYAKIGDIPSLTGYSTTDEMNAAITAATASTTGWVESQGYLTEHQDLSDYALTTAVTQDINTAIAAETARTEETYAKPSQIPSLADYWTSAQTQSAITAATDGLATEGYVESSITAATASETARTESTYAKIGDVPSLAGYWTSAETQNAITAATDDMATETWVGEQGYLTEHQDISGKLDKTDFNTYTGATATAITATQEDINDHIADTNNPHQVTASQLGISASYDATNKTLILTIPGAQPTPVADHFYIVDSEDNEYEGIEDNTDVLTFDFTKTNTATWTLYNNNDVVTASTISLIKYLNSEPTDDTIDDTDYPVENVDMGTGDASDDGLAEVIMYVNTSTNGITGAIYISHTEDPCEGYASQDECDCAQQGGEWDSENLVCHMPGDCYDWEYWGYESYEDCSCQEYGEGCEENEGE